MESIPLPKATMETEDAEAMMKVPAKKLGEIADSKMPGPFGEKPTESIGSEGYTVKHNKYNDLDTTTKGVNCGGNSNAGKTQSYAEPAGEAPPDVSVCRNKCNACGTCVGFVDMTSERKCYFMSGMDMTTVAISHGLATYKKYFNKVKSYQTCAPGKWSANEAATCSDCAAGFYNTKANMGKECLGCDRGKFSTGGAAVCTECAPGKRSINELMSKSCVECGVSEWARNGTHVCTKCPSGRHSSQNALVSRGDDDQAAGGRICTDCPAGTSQADKGARTCGACKVGKYATTGFNVCLECNKGKFAGAESASTCVNCAVGKHAPVTGYSQCSTCAAGKFSVSISITFPVIDCLYVHHDSNLSYLTLIGCLTG